MRLSIAAIHDSRLCLSKVSSHFALSGWLTSHGHALGETFEVGPAQSCSVGPSCSENAGLD
eukprot:1237634-Alexandrium_andersonii.AAC.1